MMLIEDTPVADATLPLAAFKDHLRLGSGFSTDTVQDTMVLSFLRAALAAIEARTGKALLTRTFVWSLHDWRDDRGEVFPMAPVVSVSQVEIFARGGNTTTLAPSAYWIEHDSQQPKLRPAGTTLPTIPSGGSVKVTFDAGFGMAWAGLPYDLHQAVLMLAAHYYEYRNDTGLSEGCMPFGVSSLIERYKVMRIGLRGAL